MMNGPITTSEMVEAIRKIKLGKTPGPDGLSGLYYKKCEEHLQPLKNMMNNILEKGEIPETWKTAHITLISKGQDLTLTKKL